MNRIPCLAAGVVALASLAGCQPSTTIRVLDIDAGYRPLPGATISRYAPPRLASDPWPTTPAEVKQTDADGRTKFSNGFGRFVVTAPGRSSVMFRAPYPSKEIDLGVGNATPAK